MKNYFFENVFRESKIDRIKKLPNLNDEQKEQAIDFYKSHASGYDKYIDWNHPDKVTWGDFEKVFDVSKNTNSQKRKELGNVIRQATKDITALFNRKDIIIQGENEQWIFVSPLTYDACKYFDSFECGGGKASWCIGYEKTSSYWFDYLREGFAFVMAFAKDFNDHKDKDKDIKYMIQYQPFVDDGCYNFDKLGSVWNQKDEPIKDLYGADAESSIDMFNLSYSELDDFANIFWNKMITTDKDLITYDAKKIEDIEYQYSDISDTDLYYRFEQEFGYKAARDEEDVIRDLYYEFDIKDDFEWNDKVKVLNEDDTDDRDGTLVPIVKSFLNKTNSTELMNYWDKKRNLLDKAYSTLCKRYSRKVANKTVISELLDNKAIIGIMYQSNQFKYKFIFDNLQDYISAENDEDNYNVKRLDGYRVPCIIIDYNQYENIKDIISSNSTEAILANVESSITIDSKLDRKVAGVYKSNIDNLTLTGIGYFNIVDSNVNQVKTTGTITLVNNSHVANLSGYSSLQIFGNGIVDKAIGLSNVGIIGDGKANVDRPLSNVILGGNAIRYVNDFNCNKIMLFDDNAQKLAVVMTDGDTKKRVIVDNETGRTLDFNDENINYYINVSHEV